MDKATLNKVIEICKSEILNSCEKSYARSGDIDQSAINNIKECLIIVNKIEGIIDNLLEDGNYYD